MDGYQPKKICDTCLLWNICTKCKAGKEACKKYEPLPPPPPPKSGSLTPTYTPPPMPEVKPPKQRTVLSIRDFAILMNLANMHIDTLERNARRCYYNETDEERKKIIDEQMEELQHNTFYQDLLRIRDKLGELNENENSKEKENTFRCDVRNEPDNSVDTMAYSWR